MNYNVVTYAVGCILLGLVGIFFHEFAMQWQPVPADLPARVPLSYVAGGLLAIGGAALLNPRGEKGGALLLTIFLALWTLALNLPVAIDSPGHIGSWNSPAEITFMTTGALALFASHTGA